MASLRAVDWNDIEAWLHKVRILQGSLKDYDINDLEGHRIRTSKNIPPKIGTESNESAFRAPGETGAAGLVLELP